MSTDVPDGHATGRSEAAGFVARVVEHDDAPDECTIYPADADPEAAMTTWISAEGSDFVRLSETR